MFKTNSTRLREAKINLALWRYHSALFHRPFANVPRVVPIRILKLVDAEVIIYLIYPGCGLCVRQNIHINTQPDASLQVNRNHLFQIQYGS